MTTKPDKPCPVCSRAGIVILPLRWIGAPQSLHLGGGLYYYVPRDNPASPPQFYYANSAGTPRTR